MFIQLIIAGFLAAASAKDLTVGHDGGHLIFEQNFTASPTIWRQEKTLTVNASDSEVITKVVVIDHREDKNGEAAIVEGGEGHNNVTIELKSPAVFRGYEFGVQIYAKQEDGTQKHNNNDQQENQRPFVHDTEVNEKQVPKDVTDDVIKGSSSTSPAPNTQEVHHPIEIGQNEQQRPNRDTQGQKTEKPLNPAPVGNDEQSAKNPEETQEKQDKGFDPITNKGDWDAIVDEVFNGNKTVENNPTVETTEDPIGDTQYIDINGGIENAPQAPVEVQDGRKPNQHKETTNSQQAKVQPVPLPYAKQ